VTKLFISPVALADDPEHSWSEKGTSILFLRSLGLECLISYFVSSVQYLILGEGLYQLFQSEVSVFYLSLSASPFFYLLYIHREENYCFNSSLSTRMLLFFLKLMYPYFFPVMPY